MKKVFLLSLYIQEIITWFKRCWIILQRQVCFYSVQNESNMKQSTTIIIIIKLIFTLKKQNTKETEVVYKNEKVSEILFLVSHFILEYTFLFEKRPQMATLSTA